jgi:hypothetical protein
MKTTHVLLILSSLFVSCEKDEQNVSPVANMVPVSHIVIDGNSLAVGLGSTFGGYAKMLVDSGYSVSNCAVSGQTTAQMISNASDVDGFITEPGRTLLVVDEVTNDLWYGAEVDSAYERLVRYCDQRKAANPGLRILVITPTPRSNAGTPSSFESNRVALIEKIKRGKHFDTLPTLERILIWDTPVRRRIPGTIMIWCITRTRAI